MVGPEILREIVVKISNDRKKLMGTGFFVSETKIVTCHHVLADKSGQLSDSYFIKNDSWKDWIKVEPISERCNDLQDYAFLSSPAPINLGLSRIPIAPWDEEHKEFRSRGYDCNTEESEGASTVEGEDCRIVDRTHRGSEERWQLSTIKKTLLPGRSGSPVWSVGQKAIVGMIDYLAGDESILREKSMAILIETLPFDLSCSKRDPINVPKLPDDFLNRTDNLDRLKDLVLSPGVSKSAITGRTQSNSSVSRIGLRGMGGIGKSVLAAALAMDDQILEAFPDGVIWIKLGQQPSLPNRQLDLLKFIEENHRAISDDQDGLICLKKLLSERFCLIILDDVWSMNDVRAFDALGQNCRLLITTRDQEIVRGLKAKEFCLDVLNQEDSLELLALSSGLRREDLGPDAQEVAEECDCLPLALAMVGSMAKAALERGRTDPWEHILHRLRSADLEKIKADFQDYLYPNLMLAIEVSVESLEPDEQRRYLDLAVFPEDTDIPEAALQLLWDLDEYDTRDLADHLADRSLARFNSGLLGLHDLQHDFAVKRAGDLLALHGKLLDAYKKECSNGWHTGPNDGYFLEHLAYHLLHSGKIEDLKSLALDFRWLEARLEKTEITSLISEFDLLPNDEEMRICRDCLRRSSHVLMRDCSQLAGQLLGRMQDLSHPTINGLMEQAKTNGRRPWLRPMTASLMPPGPLIRILSGRAGWVRAVALTPDGRRAVSASNDNTLTVWDLESGREMRNLAGHADLIKAVALTPDGRRAVSASNDNTLKIWDLENGQEIRTLEGHAGCVRAVVLTPDGRRAVSASNDNTLKIWDIESGRETRTLEGHVGCVRAVALTADGRCAISTSNDNTLKVWDIESGREIRTLAGHGRAILAIALTPDGRRAISAAEDNTFKVWDVESGEDMQTLASHGWAVLAIALTSDGRRAIVASNDNTLKVWDLESGNVMQTLAGHAGWVRAVALTPDGRRAISASSDNTLKVWDMESSLKMQTLAGHAGWVNAIVLTPDGRRVISASSDNTLKVWDIETGQEIKTLAGHEGWVRVVALTLDGRRAVSASNDNTLKVWDIESGKVIQTLVGHTDWINAVVLTPDGRRAVSASDDNTLKVWDLEIGNVMQTLVGHADWVRAVALTPDGRRAISASSDNTLKIWNLESGWEIETLAGHAGWIRAVALTPDGRCAISTSSDNTLKVWDLESGMLMQTLAGHAGFVNAVVLTSDGPRAVSASDDNTLKVWDLESGKVMQTLAGHIDFVNAVILMPDRWHAVSASDDNTIKVWDLQSGSLITSFTGDSAMLSCAVAPDGLTIVAGEALGKVHFLRLEGLPSSQ